MDKYERNGIQRRACGWKLRRINKKETALSISQLTNYIDKIDKDCFLEERIDIGQEQDVILISLVRANEERPICFLNDLRRMNAAITRARMKLIILGDTSTLTKYPFYKKFLCLKSEVTDNIR